jgi:hypothetical protein
MGNYLRREADGGQPRRIHIALDRLKRAEERLTLPENQTPANPHPSLPIGSRISLESVIALSDEALDFRSRNVIRALSVFPSKPNTFSEKAALAIANTTTSHIDKLYDYGLLEASGAGRYTIHQTIAEYAKSKLTTRVPQERMVEFFINHLEINEKNYSVIDQDINNIFAALQIAFDLSQVPDKRKAQLS